MNDPVERRKPARVDQAGEARPQVRLRRMAAWLAGSYVTAVLLVWVGLRTAPEYGVLAHVFLFSPRWLLGLPVLALAPVAARFRRRWLAPVLAAGAVAMGPIAGFVVPRPRMPGHRPPVRLRVLTCNTDRKRLDQARLEEVIRRLRPDVVILQEWWGRRPVLNGAGPGWTVLPPDGEILVASRYPIRRVDAFESQPGRRGTAVRYALQLEGRAVTLIGVHLPSPREGLAAVIQGGKQGDLERALRPVAWSLLAQAGGAAAVSDWARTSNPTSSLIVAGDFNLTAESPIYRRRWAWLTDAFAAAGFGLGHTYFGGRWFYAARIDHILCGPGWGPERCWVGPDVGSEHRPLLADLAWTGQP